MEVVEVEDAHQQKGSRDKNACEQLRYSELLQAEILKPVEEDRTKAGTFLRHFRPASLSQATTAILCLDHL